MKHLCQIAFAKLLFIAERLEVLWSAVNMPMSQVCYYFRDSKVSPEAVERIVTLLKTFSGENEDKHVLEKIGWAERKYKLSNIYFSHFEVKTFSSFIMPITE